MNSMNTILHDRSEPAVLDAIDHNYRASMRAFGLASHVKLRENDSLFWFITGVPDSAFNSIMYANLMPEQIPGSVRELHQLRSLHAVPMNWLIGPSSRPTNLGQLLVAEGLTYFVDLSLMVVDLAMQVASNELPADFSIQRVTTPAVFAEWIETEQQGFEVEVPLVPALTALRQGMGIAHTYPVYHFIGRLSDQPVATASVVFAAGIIGVYDVATVPFARNRGIGTAMTQHILQAARQAGYEIAFVQPSGMAYHVYERLGFRECGVCSVFG
jgi:GNAT superfamily N-acetyltransferase